MGDFLGLGWFEILTVAVIAIIVLGPDKLPQYARKVGRVIRQFRKITSGLTQEVNKALELDELDGVGDSLNKELKEISRSLQEDAASLKKSLNEGASSLEKTVNKGLGEVKESLEKESAEITKVLKENAEDAGQGISEGLSEAKENLGVGHVGPEAMVAYQPPPPTEDWIRSSDFE